MTLEILEALNYKQHIDNVTAVVKNNMDLEISLDSILEKWQKNKNYFYKRFNNKLIVKSEKISSVIKESDEISRMLYEFAEKSIQYFTDTSIYYAFRRFIFSNSVYINGFYQNKTIQDFTTDTPSVFKIKKNMKISKAFKIFFSEKESHNLKQLQNYYSTFTQKFKAKKMGNIFLSIHPLDYLSISDNDHGWSSCHNMEEGDYRAGNLSYMADGVTLVAYYTADENFNSYIEAFDEIEWNSKQWRVLVHIKEIDDKLVIIYNKQYPYQSKTLLEEVDKFLMSFFSDFEMKEIESFDKYERYSTECFEYGETLFENGKYSLNYNDIEGDNGCYVRLPKDIDLEILRNCMEIGEAIPCLKCGSNIAYDEMTGYCEDCSGESTCSDCGGRIGCDDGYFIEDDDRYICKYCFEEHYNRCEECLVIVHIDNLIYNEVLGSSLCKSCNDDFLSAEVNLVLIYDNHIEMEKENPNIRFDNIALFEKIKNDFPNRERVIENDFTSHVSYYKIPSDKTEGFDKIKACEFSMNYNYDLSFGGIFRTEYTINMDLDIELLSETSLEYLPIIKSVEIIGFASEEFLESKLKQVKKALEKKEIPIKINKDFCLTLDKTL